MKNGIYAVKFHTPGDQGEGLLTIKEGVVNGGDDYYLYQGPLHYSEGAVQGTLRVSQWKAGNTTVFGTTGNFDLSVSGRYDDGSSILSGKGTAKHGTLEFTARHIADLA